MTNAYDELLKLLDDLGWCAMMMTTKEDNRVTAMIIGEEFEVKLLVEAINRFKEAH